MLLKLLKSLPWRVLYPDFSLHLSFDIIGQWAECVLHLLRIKMFVCWILLTFTSLVSNKLKLETPLSKNKTETMSQCRQNLFGIPTCQKRGNLFPFEAFSTILHLHPILNIDIQTLSLFHKIFRCLCIFINLEFLEMQW